MYCLCVESALLYIQYAILLFTASVMQQISMPLCGTTSYFLYLIMYTV